MPTSDSDWKAKYVSLSTEHESLQRVSDDTQKVLCRTLLRLAMSTKGLDSAIDPYVTRIYDTVKSDCGPNVRKKLDDLSDAMIRAADGKQAADPFERLLARAEMPDSGRKRANRLWQQMAKDPANTTDRQLDELLALLDTQASADAPSKSSANINTNSSADSGSEESKKGLFSRLFSHEAAGDDETRGNQDAQQPNSILKSLLLQLHWPNLIETHIQQLVGQLDDNASTDMWIQVITRVNELVVDTLSNFESEVKSAEDFLSELSSRLQELDGFVEGTHQLREASLKSGRELSQTMSEQVDGISHSMQQATDLDMLKQSVAERLDQIQAKVTEHLVGDEERHEESQKREQHLREQLALLETQAAGLKQEMLAASNKAVRDAVTGLPNRQAYDERIEQEYSRWKRYGEPLVLMVWDIDDFKKINDRYGHRAGDKALKVMASKLREALRETDFIARYGGEEFVVLLVGTDLDGARQAAEKMRLRVESTALKANDEEIRMTISGGFSLFASGDTPSDVFERADQALYKAKREGKNRWLVA